MKRSKFSEHQIIAILKAVEAGRTVRDVCRVLFSLAPSALTLAWEPPAKDLGTNLRYCPGSAGCRLIT
jgi:hypothetical protein